MAFWSSEKLKLVMGTGKVVEPFDEKAVKHGAYELSLGPEAFLTSDDDNKKKVLDEGEQLVIPRAAVGRFEERELDRKRTMRAALLSTLGIFALGALVFSIKGASSGNGGGEPPPPPP